MACRKKQKTIDPEELYKRLGCDNDITHVNRLEWSPYTSSYIFYDYDDEKIVFLGKSHTGFTNIDNVIALSHVSAFGDLKSKTTVVDDSVRKSLEFDAALLCLGTPSGIKEITDVVSLKHQLSGVFETVDNIQVVPHKVVTYREGDFFKCHVDSCEDETYVGSLIIGLNDGYEGGELKVRHGSVTKNHRAIASHHVGVNDTVFFYGNCDHWVEPVKSGVRVVMVCKVFSKEGVTERQMAGLSFDSKVEDIVSSLHPDSINFFQTHHQYAVNEGDEMDPKFLKGVDKAFYNKVKEIDSVTIELQVKSSYAKYSLESGDITEHIDENEDLFEDDYDDLGTTFYSQDVDKWKDIDEDEYSGFAGNEASHVTRHYVALFFKIKTTHITGS